MKAKYRVFTLRIRKAHWIAKYSNVCYWNYCESRMVSRKSATNNVALGRMQRRFSNSSVTLPYRFW